MSKATRYGMRPGFVHSRDMRVLLASAEAGTSKRELFEETKKFDDLIVIEVGAHRDTLSYNDEAVDQGKLFRKRVEALSPISIPPVYADGMCVIAGAGPSLSPARLEEIHKLGIPIIALGNAIAAVPFADYWIGTRDVLSYHPAAFSNQHTISFILEQFYDKPLYDFRRNRQLSITPKQLPANLSTKAFSGTVEAFLAEPRELSFMRVRTSITIGMSLAAALGFSNIVLSGVDLSTELSDFYFSGDIPSKEDADRKRKTYASLKQIFPTIFQKFSEIGIRISAIDSSPFEIPVYPSAYLLEHCRYQTSFTKDLTLSDIFKTSAADVRKELSQQERTKNKVVRPSDLVALVPKFRDEAPNLFPADVLQKIEDDLEAASKSGGCSSCKKNSIVRPLYALFEQVALDSPKDLAPIWSKYLPHKNVVQLRTIKGDHHGKYIYRHTDPSTS